MASRYVTLKILITLFSVAPLKISYSEYVNIQSKRINTIPPKRSKGATEIVQNLIRNFVLRVAIANMSKKPQGLHLKIGEVPRYPFVNQTFDVVVHLVDDNGQLKCG